MWQVPFNLDEGRLEGPDRFDVHRNPEQQAFGAGGRHFCLGTALARLGLRIIVAETLKAVPDIELDGSALPARALFVNQPKALPVRLNPACARMGGAEPFLPPGGSRLPTDEGKPAYRVAWVPCAV